MPREEKYRTFWQRFWAGFIDALVLSAVGLVSWAVFSPSHPKWIVLAWGVISYFSYPGYSILMHGRYGKTIGKRVMGVVVLDLSEQRIPTFRQAFLRDIALVISQSVLLINFFRVVVTSGYIEHIDDKMGWFGDVLSWAGLIWFLLEVVTMLANEKRRALHDRIAQTVVVQENWVTARITELPSDCD